MVIETDIWPSGIWSKRIFMSSTESMATPALPTSPTTRSLIGIVAAMGGQVEGHRKALLSGGEVAAVESVGFLGGGEAGVLANGPRLQGVHGGVRPAQEGRDAGGVVQVLHGARGRRRCRRLHGDVLDRHPGRSAGVAARRRPELGLVIDLRNPVSCAMPPSPAGFATR